MMNEDQLPLKNAVYLNGTALQTPVDQDEHVNVTPGRVLARLLENGGRKRQEVSEGCVD